MKTAVFSTLFLIHVLFMLIATRSSLSRPSFSKWLLRSGQIEQNRTLSLSEDEVTHVSERVMYKGYRNIVQRQVVLPNNKTITYDILDTHPSVVVFVWDNETKTSVLLKEFHPGPKRFLMGVVAGAYESKKHASPLEAAQFELEEEAQLQTKTWIPLLADTIPLDKYSTNLFFPYLALDCTPVAHPKPADEEEYIRIEKNVSYQQLMSYISNGEVNIISSFTIMLALQKLDELRYPLV